MPITKLFEKDIPLIKKQLEQGLLLKEIATIKGVNEVTLRDYLKRSQYEVVFRLKKVAMPKTEYKNQRAGFAQIKTVKELMAQHQSPAQIAKILDISREVYYRLIRRTGYLIVRTLRKKKAS